MLWHRGDPAGWTRYESLGIRFNSSGTGKIEDLRALLLRTPLTYSLHNLAIAPPDIVPGVSQGTDKTKCINDSQTHVTNTRTRSKMTTYTINRDAKLKTYRLRLRLMTSYRLIQTNVIHKRNRLDNRLQLLLVTQPSIRTCQGQHYHRDIACLEQEFYYNPKRGRFKSSGHSLVAVKTILPILIIKIKLMLNKYIVKNYAPPGCPLINLFLKATHSSFASSAKMATTPWNFQLRRVTIVAPTSGRHPRRNPRDPRLRSYKPPSPTRYRGQPILIPLEYSPVLDAKIPVRKLGPERSTKVTMPWLLKTSTDILVVGVQPRAEGYHLASGSQEVPRRPPHPPQARRQSPVLLWGPGIPGLAPQVP